MISREIEVKFLNLLTLEYQINGGGLNNSVGWKFAGFPISRRWGRRGGKSKNYVFTVNFKKRI